MSRPPFDKVWMTVASTVAGRSTCSARAAVGAAIVSPDNHILSTGYNGSPSGFPHCDEGGCLLDLDGHCITAIHAEQNAIIQCAVHGTNPTGATVYVTHSPCPRCAVTLVQAGVARVVYKERYRDFVMSKDLMEYAGIEVVKYKE